jgi:hypothetical protein
MANGPQRIAHAVSEGTGLSDEEVWMVVGAAALVTALLGAVRAFDYLGELKRMAGRG